MSYNWVTSELFKIGLDTICIDYIMPSGLIFRNFTVFTAREKRFRVKYVSKNYAFQLF